jgi:hypothetical protein
MNSPDAQKVKPYHTPKLVVYGDIGAITQSANSASPNMDASSCGGGSQPCKT